MFSNLMNEMLPTAAVDFIASFGFVSHYQSMIRGLIDSRDVLYFMSVIVLGLALNVIVLDAKKAV